MRLFVLKQLVLCSSLLVLVSCSGGGGDNAPGNAADTMTVTVVNQSAGTTTTTYTANGTDITTFGGVSTFPDPDGLTYVNMNSPSVQVVVSANGMTAGTYPITGSLAVLSVRYTMYTSPTTTEIYATDGSGTIEITSIGAVGQQITGSFNAVVYKGYPVSGPTSTLGVSGTFSVERFL
jgi:hypothetical protein